MSEFTRDQVLADLRATPVDSFRKRSARWGWPVPRIQRLLRSLEKSGEGVSGVSGVSASPEVKAVEMGGVSGCIGDTPPHLDNWILDKSRCEEDRYTERLIEAMNAELSAIHDEYQPIKLDQYGSHRTGKDLQKLGVPFQLAKDELVRCCRVFNPSKHGNGQLPRSLALFKRGIITAFKRDPAQIDLGIPPQLKVDRAPAENTNSNRTRRRNEAELASSPPPELLGALMGVYIEGQLTRRRS